MTASLFGTFLWDRLMIAIFAPDIFGAMMHEVRTTRLEDLLDVLWTVGKIMIGLAIYLTGNPLIWMGAIWMYRNRKKPEE